VDTSGVEQVTVEPEEYEDGDQETAIEKQAALDEAVAEKQEELAAVTSEETDGDQEDNQEG
jgi:hypothetical protein